ncbi:MAG: hypothetical protein MJZ66_00885 [Bacteroidales bacterium]|nr:hypothetical protein [Bacteroidales bacterium]
MRKLLIALSVAIIIGAISCDEIETYDPMPRVEFTKVYLADTLDELQNEVKLQRIHLEVIDGDGNLGLNRDDNKGQFDPDSIGYNNLFITVFHKTKDGSYQELTEISDNMRYRIPYKEPIGQNQYMKAEIIVKVEVPLAALDYDTIRYEFFVFDRKMNKSNVATSCDIPARRHGTVFADGHTSFVKEETDSDEDADNKEKQ